MSDYLAEGPSWESMPLMEIVINGIGVAGPALAWWLAQSGHRVLLVEEAPELRAGGYIIDFWGIGFDLAERMGLIGEIRRLGYAVEEVRFVNREGRKRGGFGTGVFRRLTDDRFTSLRRSDVSATIYRALPDTVQTLFGDSVSGLDTDPDGVQVSFDRAPSRRADLVIGADGLHSRIRRLVFGPDKEFEVPLGYHVAACEVEGYRPRDELVYLSYSLPGRQLSRFAMRDDRTLLLFVLRDEYVLDREPRRALQRAFEGCAGREWPAIADALEQVPELYFDRVSQIRMNRWSSGRVALVGDAAACVSLMGGEGTGLAIAEAYVLAGELHAAGGDFTTAFARYEQRLMPFLARKQEAAARFAAAFAPRTSLGIAVRNLVTTLMRLPLIADLAIGRSLRDDLELPRYALPPNVT